MAQHPPSASTSLLSGLFSIGLILLGCDGQKHTEALPLPTQVIDQKAQQSICKASGNDQVREKRTTVGEWAADLIECTYGLDASDALLTDLYILRAGDRPLRLAAKLTGSVIILRKSKSIFACEEKIAMGSKGPILAHIAGAPTILPEHAGTVSFCERAGNGEQVLVQYADAEAAHPFAIVRVFNGNGALIVEKRFDDAGDLEFEVEGKTYSTKVAKPDFPG